MIVVITDQQNSGEVVAVVRCMVSRSSSEGESLIQNAFREARGDTGKFIEALEAAGYEVLDAGQVSVSPEPFDLEEALADGDDEDAPGWGGRQ